MVDASEENKLIAKGYNNIVGVDEAGMGSLVGDVYAAAVILPHMIKYDVMLPGLDDSKKKTSEERDILYKLIKKHAVASAVAKANIEEIATHNIYWARFLAVKRAIQNLGAESGYVLMDGNAAIPDIEIPQKSIIKGDTKSISIAAASILAKVERDRYMKDLSANVPEEFGWSSNKGYYSKKHVEAIKKYGKTEYHREKFISKFI